MSSPADFLADEASVLDVDGVRRLLAGNRFPGTALSHAFDMMILEYGPTYTRSTATQVKSFKIAKALVDAGTRPLDASTFLLSSPRIFWYAWSRGKLDMESVTPRQIQLSFDPSRTRSRMLEALIDAVGSMDNTDGLAEKLAVALIAGNCDSMRRVMNAVPPGIHKAEVARDALVSVIGNAGRPLRIMEWAQEWACCARVIIDWAGPIIEGPPNGEDSVLYKMIVNASPHFLQEFITFARSRIAGGNDRLANWFRNQGVRIAREALATIRDRRHANLVRFFMNPIIADVNAARPGRSNSGRSNSGSSGVEQVPAGWGEYRYRLPTVARSNVTFSRSARAPTGSRAASTNFSNQAMQMKVSELANTANSGTARLPTALYVRGQPGFFTLESLKRFGKVHPLTRATFGKTNVLRAVKKTAGSGIQKSPRPARSSGSSGSRRSGKK